MIIPSGLLVSSTILHDHVKSVDWRLKSAELICSLPPAVVAEVLGKLRTLRD
jgi:mRNA interferase MazF